jgi:hypothetical protein
MTFIQKLSSYSLGFITDKDLPDVAMTVLEEGYDSDHFGFSQDSIRRRIHSTQKEPKKIITPDSYRDKSNI